MFYEYSLEEINEMIEKLSKEQVKDSNNCYTETYQKINKLKRLQRSMLAFASIQETAYERSKQEKQKINNRRKRQY